MKGYLILLFAIVLMFEDGTCSRTFERQGKETCNVDPEIDWDYHVAETCYCFNDDGNIDYSVEGCQLKSKRKGKFIFCNDDADEDCKEIIGDWVIEYINSSNADDCKKDRNFRKAKRAAKSCGLEL